jgi:CBS domain containing-hemolysin-like protein
MIVGATQLRYMQAHDVMLPREEVHFLSGQMKRDEAKEYVRKTRHSRFPYSPTRDLKDVSGIVLVKDLLTWMLHNDTDEIDWQAVTSETLIVPPNVPLMQLLRTFQDERRHLAVIIDEYGTVEGIVTLEDVLEEIVGDIFDESDLPMREFQELEDGSLIAPARVDLRKLSTRLAIVWDPKIEASTIGGLVTEKLERIPRVGDTISWRGYRIEVLRAEKRRATLLRIRKE